MLSWVVVTCVDVACFAVAFFSFAWFSFSYAQIDQIVEKNDLFLLARDHAKKIEQFKD
jgi:hypothetical protein